MSSTNYPPLGKSPDGIKMIIISAIFYAVSIAAIITRIWSRVLQKKSLVFNDYAACMAVFFTTGLATITITAVPWAGSGRHMTEIAPRNRNRIFLIFTMGQSVWAAANTCVKFSILHLYMELFPSKKFHKFCIGTMVVAGLYFISVLLETFLLCTPVQFNWDKTIVGSCNPHSMVAYIMAGTTNLLIDVFIVVLPMPVLWKLRLPWPKKIAIISMFSLGALICIISLIRVVEVSRTDFVDLTYASIDLFLWSIFEPTLGILNASLPVLRPIGSAISRLQIVIWAKSSFQSYATSRDRKATGSSVTAGASGSNPRPDKFRRLEDPTDRMYQLDTINLIGDESRHGEPSTAGR